MSNYNQYPQYYQYPQQPQYQQNQQYPQYPGQQPSQGVGSWFAFSDSCYLQGLVVGVGATILLTNPKVQKALVRGAVGLFTAVQSGIEEMKEQYEDMKAEAEMKESS